MWISKGIKYPEKEGRYKCLIEIDEFGSLQEQDNQYFNGYEWCHMESSRQFISYWWSDDEDILKELQERFLKNEEVL
jgi:hypothetical protein